MNSWLVYAADPANNNISNYSFVSNEYSQTLYQNLIKKLTDKDTASSTRRGAFRRVVGGQNTSISEVPWQVSLRYKTNPICGGSIITETWIITAAHCFKGFQTPDLSVRVGSSWKTEGGDIYKITKSLIHPSYIAKTKAYDVGLLAVHMSMKFSKNVLPVQLIERDHKLRANRTAVISGWGKLGENSDAATYLQATTITTVPMKVCLRTAIETDFIDPPTMFCAGSNNYKLQRDACQGDSGGPIVSDAVLIGIVSFGVGCARSNFPGVYVRISNPTIWDWIQSNVAKGNNPLNGANIPDNAEVSTKPSTSVVYANINSIHIDPKGTPKPISQEYYLKIMGSAFPKINL